LPDPNAPFFIVFNAASGASDAAAARAKISATLDAAGRAHEFLIAESGSEVEARARQAAERASASRGVVVAAGGDGTINAAARATLATGSPLGIIPQGTFNYTTRAHGIPSDTTEATLALLNARVVRIQVGLVNDHPFLVNAGVGLHPELFEDREAYKAKFGRYRAVAFGAGLHTVFREHRQLLLEIEHEGQRELVRTPSLFVGNNALQFAQTGLEQAEEDVEHSRLAAVLVKPISSWALLGLALRGALGRLGDDQRLLSFGFRRLVVKPHSRHPRRQLKVATDGEVRRMAPPLVFTIAAQRLPLLVPAETTTPP
jgi:diacylglycerol kinase family enzyme